LSLAGGVGVALPDWVRWSLRPGVVGPGVVAPAWGAVVA